MTIATFTIRSTSLNKQTQVQLLLPAKRIENQPVLFLLHGLSDDASAWLTMSSLARYAEELPFAIVMPDGGRSFYHDLPSGERYWQYLTTELPQFLRTWFNWPLTRNTTFASGLSMGGYGAFKLALTYPERYGAAVSLSGCLDLNQSWQEEGPLLNQIFGSQTKFQNSSANLLNLLANQKVAHLPLLQFIGTNDSLLTDNRTFHTFGRQYLNKLDYREQTGTHNWEFWDTYLPVSLQWLNERYQQLNQTK
ncbi:alpha/beta hydrolase [Lapidilactobacillus gannanensis]|uniref:Alpha/beta hydrolase n=1 Tax=Lapidilactobacillus gannanensis TaxID=2486002 RepID=A0ABW4BLU0_9LACO|nr:alpha/beta hydrolase family protein [Lapidilactobacillus gannanensis]